MLSSIGLLHSFTENASKSICTVFAQHFSICVNICKSQSLLINITLLFMAITNTSSKNAKSLRVDIPYTWRNLKTNTEKFFYKRKKKWNENKCQSNMRQNQIKNKIYFHVRVSKTCGRHWKIRITLERKCEESRYWFWS